MTTPVHLRMLLVLTVALASVPVTAAVASAAPGDVRESTRSVYTLDPGAGRIRVAHRIALTNERRRGAVRQWSAIRVPTQAWDVRVKPRTTSLRRIDADALGITYLLDLEPLKPRRRTVVTVRYDLASAPPGFPLTTRVAPDYARFCWAGVGSEKGTVSARIPPGWVAHTTAEAVTAAPRRGATVLRKPDAASPGDFYACTDAFPEGPGDRVYVLGPSEQLITIDGRPSHLGWKDAMSQVVVSYLGRLEAAIGVPMPYTELRIREVARVMPFDTRSDIRPGVALLSVDEEIDRPGVALLSIDEHIDRPGVATVALARTWFNATTIEEPWLEQGLALWSGLAVAGLPCPEAGTAPLDPPPRLASWYGPAPPRYESDRAVLAWQGRVACSIVEAAAAAIGAEAMTQVTGTLLGAAQPADWRAWLAALAEHPVDADADVPADFAVRDLLEHGVITADQLAEHDPAE